MSRQAVIAIANLGDSESRTRAAIGSSALMPAEAALAASERRLACASRVEAGRRTALGARGLLGPK